MAVVLPNEFNELQRFVEYWAAPTAQRRFEIRCESDMTAITEFYDSVLARGEDILRYLEKFPLANMPPQAELLFKLLLSLAHVAMAVEIHGEPRVPHSPYPNGLRITQGPIPLG